MRLADGYIPLELASSLGVVLHIGVGLHTQGGVLLGIALGVRGHNDVNKNDMIMAHMLIFFKSYTPRCKLKVHFCSSLSFL